MTARPTTTDWVFALLREQIVSGILPAGSQHSIYRLADQLEVSRTPVREAVLRLADLGLVEIERNRGVRVRGVSVEDVREVFEMRLVLESAAAAGAARRVDADLRTALSQNVALTRRLAEAGDQTRFAAVDREFHVLVSAALGSRRLEAEVTRLRDSIQARGVSTFGRSRPLTQVAQEHAAIADAVVSGDPVAAAGAMADHLDRTGTLLMAQVAAGEPTDAQWSSAARAALAAAGSSMLLTNSPDEGLP